MLTQTRMLSNASKADGTADAFHLHRLADLLVFGNLFVLDNMLVPIRQHVRVRIRQDARVRIRRQGS